MSDDEKRRRGAALARRRDRLMNPTKFAAESGINRSQVTNVENGTAHTRTFARYEEALEQLEIKMGVTPEASATSEGDHVKVELAGSFGVRISAEGSRGDVDHVLRVSVAELVAKMNEGGYPQSA